MPYADITGTIPQLVVDEVTTKLNEIKTALEPYVRNLSVEERKNYYKMGANRYSLGQNTIIVCDTLPPVVPSYVNVNDGKDDFEGVGQLAPMLQLSQQISESCSDTMMARGSEFLTKVTKPVYANVKVARESNVPGADAAYDLLNPYFDLPDQPDGGNP